MAIDTGPVPTVITPSESSVLEYLEAGVPLTLLLDLASTSGPDSDAIFTDEPAESLDWIPTQSAPGATS